MFTVLVPRVRRERLVRAGAVVMTLHGLLALGAFLNIEARLIFGEMTQGDVTLAVLVVEIFEVPLAEGAAPAVLPAQSNRSIFEHQAAEGQGLTRSPIPGGSVQDLFALLDEVLQLRMQM